MTRQPRINAADTWHHVMNRGADKQDIFTDDNDRLYFEALLEDITSRFGIEVHAYCLMGNHFHLLVYCPTESLSEAIQHLSSKYATYYNRTYERSGPLFGGRFRSVIVDSDAQLAQVSRYIHRNPLALVPLKGLAAYRWASHGIYCGRRARPNWMHCDSIIGLDGFTRDSYETYVESAQPSDAGLNGVLESTPLECEEIEAAIAHIAGVDVATLYFGRHGVLNSARLLALLMITELRVASTKDLASRFRFGSLSGVRAATRRARVLLADDPDFARMRVQANETLGV